MRKTIEVSKSKALRVEPAIVNGQPYVSLTQLYKRQGDPEWRPAKVIGIDLEYIDAIVKYLKKYRDLPLEEFTVIEFERSTSGKRDDGVGKTVVKRGSKPAGKTAAKAPAAKKTSKGSGPRGAKDKRDKSPPWND